MKKNIFALLTIFGLSFVFSVRVFAERGDSIISADIVSPLAWQYANGSFINGIGVGVNKIILPKTSFDMGVDFGANISVPFQLFENYAVPINSQLMFGILLMPFNFNKWYFGIGGALGVSMRYSLPKDAYLLDSNFLLDFGVGAETRGGVMVTKKYALTFGCTILYDFYRLDVPNRRYIRESVLTVQPSIGFGIKK